MIAPETKIKKTDECCVTCGQAIKKPKPSTIPVWDAYSAAYFARYKVEPIRNATVNGQLSQFVSRVGIEAAPQVAAFYVQHNDRFYVQKQHPVGLMLQNAEGLHTQWASGKTMTTTGARQIESRQAALDSHNEALAILEARGKR